jgi:HEAT repeat protein
VIDQASLALGRIKDPRAFDAIVKLTATPSWKGRIQIAGLNGLAELGDKGAFETGYKMATDRNLAPNIRAAATAVVGASGKGDPRAYDLIYAAFKKAFDSGNVGNLTSTLQAIIKIADPRGQAAFDMLKVKYKDNPAAMQAIAQVEAQFKAALKP